jgi:hypothetical protein
MMKRKDDPEIKALIEEADLVGIPRKYNSFEKDP